MRPLARYLDPRRSLVSAVGWLVITLSVGLVLVASVWVDDIVRALAAILTNELQYQDQATVRRLLRNLQHSSPGFERIVVADAQGQILAGTGDGSGDASFAKRSWIALGQQGSRIGDVRVVPTAANSSPGATGGAAKSFVELAASVTDAKGNAVGVIGIRLSEGWLLELARNLGRKLRQAGGTEALLLDRHGAV